MILSMTGFGSASRDAAAVGLEGVVVEVEARSVNHRHLDLRIRLPKRMGDRETALKQRVQGRLGRGKVDVTVNLVLGGATTQLEIDETVAAQYVDAARALGDRHGLDANLDASTLLALPGVTRVLEAELDPDRIGPVLDAAFDAALDALVEMRTREGQALAAELESRLGTVDALAQAFEVRADEVLAVARQRLEKRAEQIKRDVGMLDEARLHQEIVIAADRLDITEELVRLRSHVAQFREILAGGGSGEPVGRRLDFLLQELGREANTVGSKANDAPLAQDVVALKTELERIREQVQNVE